MTALEIKDVIQRFVDTAVLVAEAGFDGIELHSAHGYLLAQFLAEATNKRTDEYGGSVAARAKIVVEVIEAIRAAVPAGFSIGIKFNSVDHQSPSALRECIEQLQLIVHAGIDFLEISGGTYEDPQVSKGCPRLIRTVDIDQTIRSFTEDHSIRHRARKQRDPKLERPSFWILLRQSEESFRASPCWSLAASEAVR